MEFEVIEGGFELRHAHEVLRVEHWGADSVRVRAALHRIPAQDVGALQERPPGPVPPAAVRGQDGVVRYVVGALTVEGRLDAGDGKPAVMLRFVRTADGAELLAEKREHFWWPGSHVFYGQRSGLYEIHQQFEAYEGERIYGLGQHQHGRLDHKGLVVDLIQRNSEVSIPFYLSSRGYGFLWNNPAVGRVELADNATRWVADSAPALDYWVTAGDTPASILGRYADAVGHAPVLPEWASGFWQCKLRYMGQEEILDVAREYRRRGLPLSVIVSDFFHWTAMGDYRFDPEEYPDPAAMVCELEEMGVRLMVSVWPTVSPLSENYDEMASRGMLVGTDQGVELHQDIHDKQMPRSLPVAFYDPSNPRTRRFVWDTVKRNYFDLGVRVWWLDACEPELNPCHPTNLSFHSGPGAAVVNTYPRDNARLFFEGNRETGEPGTVLLCRSAWAGQARYGAAVWSGDIPPTWESLAVQVRAGLSIAIAGIPWWTTDIGGFHGGDPSDEAYRELYARWFAYGAFCPLFRLHGHREPRGELGSPASGGPNEVWSYGERCLGVSRAHMELRERLRPYIGRVMREAADTGVPPMRALFLQFPEDRRAWDVDDQFLLGPDLLVAPVLSPGVTSRQVYLPAGARWREIHSGRTWEGGMRIEADAPYEYIPVFVREGADVGL
ncbi:glycoside hydrolase family 31 protein [Actinomyces howellii]|uniref:Alpha-xylosidase n=1 Tax=Actinomyces howellii TaxID=52771 RepID=A0A3S4RAN1_9ACTO|nr:TIM-barrel domain-containing protein [Actinomyces howellii]VEG27836.1 Alpha-xylosidase [Actinomyces howellii]